MRKDLKSWMNKLDDNRNLFELDIPGTHDCVTQFIQLPHICRCQNMNVYEQLCIGVRALDIRVQSRGERLGMVHGIAKAFNTPNRLGKQMDLADVLEHCFNFLRDNPSESIIFQFKNDSNNEMEKCFDNLYYRYIKGNEDKWYLENKIPSLGEVRGKLVLVRRCKMDLNNSDFTEDNTGIDFSRWAEQDTAVPEPLLLDTYSKDNASFIVQDRFKYKPVPRWSECIKPFLDARAEFDGQYVICYLSTAGGIKGPENNAKYINQKFMTYPIDKNKYYGTVYLDFPSAELTAKIIENNF
ncbi:MAG: phosphatidylinositol-specific phospholipase C domain-containing protein [Eubacterium sp.]